MSDELWRWDAAQLKRLDAINSAVNAITVVLLITKTDSPPVTNWRRAGAIVRDRSNTLASWLRRHANNAAVPTGPSNGIPLGVQIIGSRYREDLCLDAAETIEAQCGLDTPIDLQW
jgi:Asp-tRNA(Asn)/Glu-tRNA(Gln) amidotransferase A subunit family amidase